MDLGSGVMVMLKKYHKITKYLKEHPNYNSFVHIFAGIAVGIMMTYPYVGNHPVRWAVAFLAIATMGHVLPLFMK